MKKYSVSYDLNKDNKNYDGLYSAIQSYPAMRALDSTWFIKTDSSASDIYKHLSSEIDKDDSIFISEINSNRQGYLSEKIWNWLKS